MSAISDPQQHNDNSNTITTVMATSGSDENTSPITVAVAPSTSSSSASSSPSGSISAESSLTRSLRHCRRHSRLGSFLNPYFGEPVFDGNTFKQIKRLYCGMLMVAMAYSVTMVIMMVVLYKSLPDPTMSISPYHSGENDVTGFPETVRNRASELAENAVEETGDIFGHETHLLAVQDHHTGMMYTPPRSTYYGRHSNHQSTRTYLDQVIAINFLTSILYLLSFYAAQREFYNLTLAFTTCMAVSMVVSLVKILTEGTHLPNNLMGLLLRASIVFVALIYCSQIRRKQEFIAHTHSLWLTGSGSGNHHSALRVRSDSTTVQFLNELLNNHHQQQQHNSNKSEEGAMAGFDDLPPDYEEALRCPAPRVRPPVEPLAAVVATNGPSSSSSSSSISPPSFEDSMQQQQRRQQQPDSSCPPPFSASSSSSSPTSASIQHGNDSKNSAGATP